MDEKENLEKDEVNIKDFIVPYTYPLELTFPPYNLTTLRNNNYENDILYASVNDKDVTDYIIKLAGPFCDFYTGLNNKSIRVLTNIFSGNVEITNTDADEFNYKMNEYITYKKK